jgi:chromosomal replication initiation ATPase DnaA
MIDQQKSEAYLKGFEDGYKAKSNEINDKKKTLRKSVLLVEFIENLVLEHYSLVRSQVDKRYRGRVVVEPRQIIMYLLKTETSLSLKEVGNRYGGRDHTTVIHAITTVKNRMHTEEDYRETIKSFQLEIVKYINTLKDYDSKIESAVSQLLSV